MRLLLALLLTLLLPAAAGAATVTRTLAGNVYTGSGCSRYQMCDQRYWLAQLSDAGAEPNDVTVEVVADGLVFRDAATPPTAGEGCAARAGGVWCPAAEAVAVRAGGGDDRAVATLPGVLLSGGSGADELAALGDYAYAEGGEGDDVLRGNDGATGTLDGGAGADMLLGGAAGEVLDGGPGEDTVLGGAGDDELRDEWRPWVRRPEADADVYDGGEGTDLVDYSGASAPVDVDLARGTGNGQAGEGDAITGVEDARGGRGADRLAGDDGVNVLDGGSGGADHVDGRGGDDRLGARRATCGAGRDEVYRAARVARDCERIPLATTTARIVAGELVVRDVCDRIGRRCRFRLTLRDSRGDVVARARARRRPGRHAVLRARLPAAPGPLVARYQRDRLRIG